MNENNNTENNNTIIDNVDNVDCEIPINNLISVVKNEETEIIRNDNSSEILVNADENQSEPNIIKHIVISGGGQYGFYSYGFLKESSKHGIWNINNIKSFYGTSVGALIAATLCLKYDWDILDKYLIKRPWHNIFKIDLYTLFDAIKNKGIFNINVFKEFFLPLFKGTNEDISIDVTMKEYYEITKIDLHIFVTEINNFKIIDISHETHPDYNLIEALYESCSIPIVFSPLIKENFCNIDGGLIVNYPIEYCLNNVENPNEIMGILKIIDFENNTVKMMDKNTTFLDYLMIIFNKFIKRFIMNSVKMNQTYKKIKNQYIIKTEPISIVNVINILSCSNARETMIKKGVDIFYQYKNSEYK